MRTDTRDLVSATEVSKNPSRYIAEAAAGRTLLVLKNNQPTAAIVSIEKMAELSRLEEREEDLRMLSIAVVRSLTDDHVRHDLADVAAEFGVDLTEED